MNGGPREGSPASEGTDGLERLLTKVDALRASDETPLELAVAAPLLDQLAAGLKAYPTMALESQAVVIDTYFSIWERTSERFKYGYPLGVMHTAILSGDPLALAAAIKALLYLETGAVSSLSGELETARQTVTLAARQSSLTSGVRDYRRTGSGIDPELFSQLLGEKINAIALSLFEAAEVVPALAALLVELQRRSPEYASGASSELQYPLRATRHGLEKLRMYRQPRGVSPAATAWFEKLVADGDEPWQSKVQFLTQGQLYEGRPYPRTFEQMIPAAQQLILKGLRSHPDPMVRLDCLKVYDRDVDRYAHEIAAAIDAQAKTASAEDRERLKRVAAAVDAFAAKRQHHRES
jgi:hypothetical protein